ncbi:DUF5053 domain-containing protein [Riemerella columbipharyngis]|uniref:DUF5053 domain-containing protein n=1 Tax=Riemerella columbipharyngis TaxID=1071918 RepID=A0A1G7F0K8_9FLAO|nr:DUF5053 domain-containing protein [Riemerella columbipharyngis]SDE69480.1 protein of unknown function [Riemerella columbipharyngis]
MEITTKQPESKMTMKQQLWDIIVEISWGEISEQYFKKSRSWLSKKMNGKGFNGEANADFTPEEKEILKGALIDLSERIRKAANGIQ